MLGIFILGVLAFQSIGLAVATHCYECNDMPHLRDCDIVRQCNSHEECYVEQLVTTSGHVVFNSGCRDRQRCAQLSGRSIRADYTEDSNNTVSRDLHDVHVVRREDVSVCEQCCDTDYCNNQGCFDVATPLNQRGPYCFSCQRQGELESCRTVTQCSPDQVCFIEKMLDSGLTVYDSHCIEKLQCDVIKKTYQQSSGKRSVLEKLQVDDVASLEPNILDLVKLRHHRNTRVALCIQCCETDFCNKNCTTHI